MWPVLAQFPNRSNNFGIKIKGDGESSSRLTIKEKGKTKVLNVVKLEKIEPMEDPMVMPIGKRTIEERGVLQVSIIRRKERAIRMKM